jgi:WD40 repeat protein
MPLSLFPGERLERFCRARHVDPPANSLQDEHIRSYRRRRSLVAWNRMITFRRFTGRHARKLLLLASGMVLFLLWFGLWLRVLPLKPRLEWKLPDETHVRQLSENGRVVVTAKLFSSTSDGVSPIRVWDTATGRLMCELIEPGHEFFHLTLSPDGQRLACNYADPAADTWVTCCFDLETGREVLKQPSRLTLFTFSPDSRYLVYSAKGEKEEEVLHLVDARKGVVLRTFPHTGQNDMYPDHRFSHDCRLLAIYSHADRVHIWDIAGGQVLREFPSAYPPIEFSMDDSMVAFAGGVEKVRASYRGLESEWAYPREPVTVFELTSGKRIAELVGHKEHISHFVFRRDNSALTALHIDSGPDCVRTATTWALNSGKVISHHDHQDHDAQVALTGQSRIGVRYLWIFAPETVRIEDLWAGQQTLEIGEAEIGEADPYLVMPDSSGRYIVYPSEGKHEENALLRWLRPANAPEDDEEAKLILVDLKSRSKIAFFENARFGFFTADSQTLLVETLDGHLQAWDLPPHRPILLLLALAAGPAILFTGVLWWRLR